MANWLSNTINRARTYAVSKLSRDHQYFSVKGNDESRSSANKGIFTYLFGSETTLNATLSQAEKLATVWVCIDFLARTRAMLPLNVFDIQGNNKSIAYNHSAQFLLHNRPNPNMNAYQFWYAVEYCKHYNGNAYAWITRTGKKIERLDLLNPDDVTVRYVGGELYYHVKGELVNSLNLLHFKNFSTSGLIGESTLSFHAETFGHSVDLRRFARRNLKANPPAYATSQKDKPTTHTGKEQLGEYLSNEMQDYAENGRMPFLYAGFEIKTLGLKPQDAAYLEQISASKEDIYGIFGVNPGLVGAYKTGVTYNNLEQQNLQYTIYTLTPKLVGDEQELNYKVFTESERATKFCKFNEKALMRTDLKTQSEWMMAQYKMGVLNRNEVRDILDLNPVDGGDVYYIEGNNMIPLDSKGMPIMPAGQATKRDIQTNLQQVLRDAGINTTLNGQLHYEQH